MFTGRGVGSMGIQHPLRNVSFYGGFLSVLLRSHKAKFILVVCRSFRKKKVFSVILPVSITPLSLCLRKWVTLHIFEGKLCFLNVHAPLSIAFARPYTEQRRRNKKQIICIKRNLNNNDNMQGWELSQRPFISVTDVLCRPWMNVPILPNKLTLIFPVQLGLAVQWVGYGCWYCVGGFALKKSP